MFSKEYNPHKIQLILFTLLTLSSFTHLLAQKQICNPVFQNYYGGQKDKDDEAINITYCSGGGMIVCGQTTSYSAGLHDGFLLKLKDDGAVEWTKVIGGVDNDKLTAVRQTSDGGYIAIGTTSSYDNTKSVTWVIKTDSLGKIQWNKRYTNNGLQKETAKDIIQLRDGDYCFAINNDDSTSKSNAIITRLDNLGNVKWNKMLDNGNDDGVNNVAEYKNTLLIAGYSTEADGRDAVITSLNLSNGSFISAKKYSIQTGNHEEALNIETSGNDIAFSVSMYPSANDGSYYAFRLVHFKIDNKDSLLYKRRIDVSTSSGMPVEHIQSRTTDDNGFITLANDVTNSGNSMCEKLGPYGQMEWGRGFGAFSYNSRITGLDITADRGYVFAGFNNDYFITAMKNKIQIFKTDRIGKTGDCTINLSGNFTDTSYHQVTAFQWSVISESSLVEDDNLMATASNPFSLINSCSSMICDTIQELQDGCSSNLLAEYKSELILKSNDITRLSDGSYAFAGSYSYYWNQEPAIVKTNPNGSIAWAKTYNDFIHDAYFRKIIAASGNTMLLMGQDSYTINHSGTDSAIIAKIDYSGNLLWSKKYAKGYGTYFSDMQATDDGGFVITMNENFGMGSGQQTIVCRLDANGNFLWKKRLNSLNLVVRNLLVTSSAAYLTGTAYIDYSEASVSVIRLDLATGNMLWQKTLKSNTPKSIYPISLGKTEDTLVVSIDAPIAGSDYYPKRKVGFITLNAKSGKVYSAYELTNINYIASDLNFLQSYPVWAGVSGEGVVFANAAVNGSDTSVYLSKIDLNGKHVWGKKYPNLKKQLITSFKQVSDGLLFTGFTRAGMAEWNVTNDFPFILKTDKNGIVATSPASSTCINSDFNTKTEAFSIVDDIPRVTSVEPLPESNFEGYLNYTIHHPYVRDIKKISKVYCNTISNCNKIKINGPDSICNPQNTVAYKIEKNATCNAAAIWQMDTSYTRVIESTDSTLKLKFLKPGLIQLKAYMASGCTSLSDTKSIFIARQAYGLNLGLDTQLCVNNTLTLKAGSEFKTYSWSDIQSNDSTRTISKPGLYILSVTDFCGNRFSDSINISEAKFPFSVGPDTSKCNNDSLLLTVTDGFTNYSWQPAYNLKKISPTKAMVFPSVDTSYIIRAEKWKGCFVLDTVHITVKKSPPISLGADTLLCPDQTMLLDVGEGFASYNWNNGKYNTQVINVYPGTYTIVAFDKDGCSSLDTINISNLPLPIVHLGEIDGICAGGTRVIDAGDFTQYVWQDGSGKRTFEAHAPGIFYVQVTNENGCKGSDTTTISTVFQQPKDFLPIDTEMCRYGSLMLSPSGRYKSYLWNTQSTSDHITISESGLYWLQVEDEHHCIGKDTIVVNNKNCMEGVYVPSAFSPNNDGKNDIFRPIVFKNIISYQFTIYNRWGQIVFQTTDTRSGWDGRVKGITQPMSTYVWICHFSTQESKNETMKGTVTLIK